MTHATLPYARGDSGRQKRALVLGAGGFIGSHMVDRLVEEGYWVRGADTKRPEFGSSQAHEFVQGDLRDSGWMHRVLTFAGYGCNFYASVPERMCTTFDEVYQFAADMGGAGFVFTGDNDADIMHNSTSINLNILDRQKQLNASHRVNQTLLFYSSSACIYPEHNQLDASAPDCREDTAYPAKPDSEYGWEKIFSERLFMAYMRNALIPVRIARYHNIFGPLGTWKGGREKAPAAICRKVADLPAEGGEIEIWGDGQQTRTFLFIDECITATRKLMQSSFTAPVNIGSEELVSIDALAQLAAEIARKPITIRHVAGPQGVRGRTSHNALAGRTIGWDNQTSLRAGLSLTYAWVATQVENERNQRAAMAVVRLSGAASGALLSAMAGARGEEILL